MTLENHRLHSGPAQQRHCRAVRDRLSGHSHRLETWLEKVLVPELLTGEIFVLDNLSSHKGPRIRKLIEAAGAELRYLPPYSPDFKPVENAFAKLRALLRKEEGRTIDGRWTVIGRLIDLITPTECVSMSALRNII